MARPDSSTDEFLDLRLEWKPKSGIQRYNLIQATHIT